MQNKRIAIVGGGAAGLFAAASVPDNTSEIIVFEKNKYSGKKLLITGKGRCNVTNASEQSDFFKNVSVNPRFLFSSFNSFSNDDTINFFEAIGVPLKTERGNRVFPVSDKALDIRNALLNKAESNGVKFIYKEIKKIEKTSNGFNVFTHVNEYFFDKVIIATGGISYPLTGSTGDGYKFAQSFGHSIVSPKPSLVPLVCKEKWCAALMGLSLKNVKLKIINSKNSTVKYEDFGEMLFTHYGISGPIVLSATSYVRNFDGSDMSAVIDLKPALTAEQLSKRIISDFNDNKNKDFQNSLSQLLPAKLIPVIVSLSGIPAHKKVNEITKAERLRLVDLIKNLTLHISGTRPISEAIITSGGVSVTEINPKTMESKLIEGLYFAGEVIDVDAYTGGFNLQIAFSTAYSAISSAIN